MTASYISFRSELDEQKAVSCLLGFNDKFISGSWNGTITMWKLSYMEAIPELNCLESICSDLDHKGAPTPPMSPNSESIVINLGAEKLKSIYEFGKYLQVKCMAVEDPLLVVGHDSFPFISMVNFRSFTQETIPIDHINNNSRISCIDLNNKKILAGTESGVYFYDIKRKSFGFHNPFRGAIIFLKWIKEAKTEAVLMTEKGEIGLWKIDAINCVSLLKIQSIEGLSSGYLSKLDPCNNEEFSIVGNIVAGYSDGNVRSWKILNREGKYAISYLPLLSSLSDCVTCLSITCNMIFAGSWDGRVRIWDLKTASLRRTLKSTVTSAILSITHQQGSIVTGHYDGSITVWDFTNAKQNQSVKHFKRIKFQIE
jgi:hypothetical protein